MTADTISLRPVTVADAGVLAELIVELYHAEEPGVLRGPRSGQLRLFRHLLEHELAGGGRGRFLAVGGDGTPTGTVSVRLPGDPTLGSLPPGLFATSVAAIGLADALRFYGYLVRGSLSSETPLRRGECYIYSVVVRPEARGGGVGTAMMARIEAHAQALGARTALLRVMDGNEAARRLYLRLGYRTIARASLLAAWLGVPSELMRKEIR